MSRPPMMTVAADVKRRETSALFRVGNLRLERRRAEIRIHTHLIRREPEREKTRENAPLNAIRRLSRV